MQAIIGNHYFKNSEVIHPGNVGSVGDVIASVRLKQSAPDMKMRYDPEFSGVAETLHGSNVQDGYTYSFTSGGGPARTLDSRWERKSFKTQHGWRFQDMRMPDKSMDPVVGSTGRGSWYNKIATIYEAKVTGNNFLPLPGAFGPNAMTRGSQIPRVIAVDQPVMPDLTDKEPQEVKEEDLKDKSVVASLCFDSEGKPFLKSVRKPPPGQTQASVTNQAPPTLQNPPPARETKAPEAASKPPTTPTISEEDLKDIRMF